MSCCINSVNAGMAARFHHGKHLGLSGDLGYGSLSTASTDSGYRGTSTASSDLGYEGSSTAAHFTRSTSHLVERQKMSMHPLAEGMLRYARTGLPRTVDFVVCMFRTLPEPHKAKLRGC